MLDTPFSPWPHYSEEEITAAERVLRSGRVNYWTGEEGRAFEREFAERVGVPHAVALANGTVALELAYRALGLGTGDEVIVTPRTFIATVSAIVACGATPVFADVDPDSQAITPESVAPLISARTKAIVCVHLGGWPAEMTAFRELAEAHGGLALVEDCAQAHGASIGGQQVGSFGDVAAWSFCQDKIISTGGEGGMVTTGREELRKRVWSLKDHGKSWEIMQRAPEPEGVGFRWVHEDLGGNGRMTEVQAAIGRIQLRRLDDWLASRRTNAMRIRAAARELSALRVPEVPAHIGHAWYRLDLFVRPEALAGGWDRDRILAEINARGVPCQIGSCPEVYREKAFVERGLGPREPLPVARQLGETSLAFLVHPTLRDEEIAKTCDVLRAVVTEATR